jgi:hypothetical protein
VFGRYKRFSTNPMTGERQISEPVYWPDLNSKSFLVGLLLDCFIFQNACLVRRKAFDAVGPFRTDLIRSQDYEMTIRLACRFDAAYVPEVVFLQRAHQALRGSAIDRFDSSRQMEKWLHYDAMFFRELYGKIPLSTFVPKSLAGTAAETSERAALLQRACIFWRRKLLDLSLSDMAKAIQMGGGNRLTATEEFICGDFLHPKFGCDELVTRQDIPDDLYSLAAESEFGRSVIKAVTTPLLWYFRQAMTQGRWRECRSIARLLLRFHGFTGTAVLIKFSVVRRLKLIWRKLSSPQAIDGGHGCSSSLATKGTSSLAAEDDYS